MARWIVMLLVGFCTGLVAVAIDFMVDKISTAKYSLIAQSKLVLIFFFYLLFVRLAYEIMLIYLIQRYKSISLVNFGRKKFKKKIIICSNIIPI